MDMNIRKYQELTLPFGAKGTSIVPIGAYVPFVTTIKQN
jgi:hypothetical protein